MAIRSEGLRAYAGPGDDSGTDRDSDGEQAPGAVLELWRLDHPDAKTTFVYALGNAYCEEEARGIARAEGEGHYIVTWPNGDVEAEFSL